MLPVAPATSRTPDSAREALLDTPLASRPLGAPIATPPQQTSRTPSPSFVLAPALTYSLWPVPKTASFARRNGFVWPELHATNPWPSAALGPSVFVRPPALLPPDPLALAHPRRASTNPTRLPRRSQGSAAGPPQRPTIRPDPLWPSFAPLPRPPGQIPSTKRGAASTTHTPALLAARPRLITARAAPRPPPPACVVCSRHPKLDAAQRLLLRPQIVWSVKRDAARALQWLGAVDADVASHHHPNTKPPRNARASLWRGMARARLADASAEGDLQSAVREPTLKRTALLHLLPILIRAVDAEPQSVARTRAEGYVNLALAQFPDAPYVRLCAALLAFRAGDVARSRQMLMGLTQSHPTYGPAWTVLAAMDAESYAQGADPKTRARALQRCKHNLSLGQHRDMALSLIHALVGDGTTGKGMATAIEHITARYGHTLCAPEDVWGLPLVVLDPDLALGVTTDVLPTQTAAPLSLPPTEPVATAAPAPTPAPVPFVPPGSSSKKS